MLGGDSQGIVVVQQVCGGGISGAWWDIKFMVEHHVGGGMPH